MSLEDPIFIELILGILVKSQLLAKLVLADRFLLRANLPPVLQALNEQVFLEQNWQLSREEQIVNQQRSTRRLSAIDVKGMDTLLASVRVKSRSS